MPISERKYQKLFEEAQADAIRFRKERDDALGWLRVIGRLSTEERIVGMCRSAVAGSQPEVNPWRTGTPDKDGVYLVRLAWTTSTGPAWQVRSASWIGGEWAVLWDPAHYESIHWMPLPDEPEVLHG